MQDQAANLLQVVSVFTIDGIGATADTPLKAPVGLILIGEKSPVGILATTGNFSSKTFRSNAASAS